MNKAYYLPLALAAAVTTAASADTYTNFLTGVSSVASDGTITAVGGNWTTTGASLAKVDGKNAVDFEVTNSLMRLDVGAPGPADTNTIVRVDLEVSLADVGSDFMTSLPTGAQTAFAVYTNAYNVWAGSTTGWVVMDEIPAGLEDAATTNLTVELNYQGTNAKRYASFFVGGVPLHRRSDDATLIELDTDADNFTGMGISGSGTIAKADAEVMLGIAEYDGVKYGTLAAAVEKAQEDATVPGKPASPISVVRETSEDVSVTSAGVIIADNGNVNGDITITGENVQVDVMPNKDEFTNSTSVAAGASGTYAIPVSISGGKLSVTLPPSMSNKEVVSAVAGDKVINVTIQTATSVLEGAMPDGSKALTHDVGKLRDFLTQNASNAYVNANVSAESIAAALAATGENDIPLYQSYALGIDSDVSVKPVTVAADTAAESITLTIPTINTAAYSGDYNITYQVDGAAAQDNPGAITVPLETGSHEVKIIFE